MLCTDTSGLRAGMSIGLAAIDSGNTVPMSHDRLRPSTDLSAAAWIAPRLRGDFASTVSSVVPTGFEAYARILHPAVAATGERVRWGSVAAAFDAVEHGLMQFHALAGVSWSTQEIKTEAWTGSAPTDGDLEPELLAALLDVVSLHTPATDECWFCLWDGYGWIAESVTARVALPGRNYLLYRGPLDAALEMGHSPLAGWFLPQSPNIFWPDDASWCVATEIDLPYTYVGGSRDLVDDLLIDVRLEVWEAHPDDPIAFDTDLLNS